MPEIATKPMRATFLLAIATLIAGNTSPATAQLRQAPGPVAAKAHSLELKETSDSKRGGAQGNRNSGVATLRMVDGNVLVSGEDGLASVEVQTRLIDGSRIITTAESRALVSFDDGCEIELKGSQRLHIDRSVPCAQRQVVSLLDLAPLAGAAGGAVAASGGSALGLGAGLSGAALAGGGTAATLGGALTLGGLTAAVNNRQSSAASPN